MGSEPKRVLIVDDEERNRKLLGLLLGKEGYSYSVAVDGVEALEQASRLLPDIILLDIMMPGIDGFEVCRRLRRRPATSQIPVIMVTALEGRESKITGLEAGANDFLSKPIDATELAVRIRNLLKVKEYEDFLVDHNRILGEQVAERTLELRDSYIDTIYRLTLAAEFKDEDTAAHIRRISLYTRHLARSIGLADGEADVMFYASPMHDVGKIGIPDRVLLKPGPLDAEELTVMKTHPAIGARILAGGHSAILRSAEIFARCHHERWDGLGYPSGLKGEGIPLEGRILNLVDQYDALRSRRPYKPALTHERTVEIITVGDGRTMPAHFEPRLLACFRERHEEFAAIFEANAG